MSYGQHLSPDWVILGVSAPPGVMLYASSDLTEAELQVEMGDPSFGDSWEVRARPTVTRVVMKTTMKTYVWVRGTDYADAIRTLFEHWSPERKGPQQLPTQPSLPSGS